MLRSADAFCRDLANRHYENFSVVSVFLPGEVRRHLTRIYAFCRTTDDFGDESEDGESHGERARRLLAWQDAVNRCFDGSPPVHPVLIALSRTIKECRLDRAPFVDLIEANVQDQSVTTYESWEDLHAYCMLSAAPVGRMVLRVFGIDSGTAVRLSDDVCIGLQLANHAQDVRRDADNGRVYVLQKDIREAGIRSGVRELDRRARSLLKSGIALEEMIDMPLRAQLALYRLGGNAILDAIEAIGYRTDVERPTISNWTKVRLLPQALMESMTGTQRAAPRCAA